jgi:hypothetical protein
MPELGPAQITALVLAVSLIGVGLTYGKGPSKTRKPRGERAAGKPPQEHQQFMRPGSESSAGDGEDVG